jgi:CheY-like chemotaxis protein
MRSANCTVLIIDDDSSDQELIKTAFQKNGSRHCFQCVNSGREAIAYLKGDGAYSNRTEFPYPSFILTDLKMRDGDGFAVLEFLKTVPESAVIPTVVFSSSSDQEDVKTSYKLGAGSYLVKPCNFTALVEMIKLFHDYWMGCEIPETDGSGKWIVKDGSGKLGARFQRKD